jgi:hypothetical protein
MKKKLLAFFIWLGLIGVAIAQSVNGVSPSVGSPDGSNVTAAKVLTFPQVQPTLGLNASPTPSPFPTQTPQVSNWYQMNGNGGALVEFQSNTFSGYYSIQVSNNPTPVSTPGLGLYTPVRDASTYATGGQGGETDTWAYMIKTGWKWFRLFVNQDAANTGTLNTQVRLFGNPPAGDAQRTYSEGVPWKSAESLFNGVQSGAATNFIDYKLPGTATGLNIYTNIIGVSGASTIITTLNIKDPVSGVLQPVAVFPTTHAAGFASMLVGNGYASPYPVATPPAGETIISVSLPQDLVIENAFTGTGATTMTQSVAPIQ